MTRDATDNPTRSRLLASRPLRYAAAVAVALAVNAAVAAMLAGLQTPSRRTPDASLATVPLKVVDTPTVPPAPREVRPATAPPVATPPAMPPALPTPPLATPQPAPPQIPVPKLPPLHTSRASLRVPEFAAKALPPAPPAVATAPQTPSPTPVAPAPTKPSGAAGVDRGPVCLEPPDLSAYYPRRARLRGTTGRTAIRLTIDAEGNVTAVQVLQSTPEGVFEAAAKRVAQTLRFLPAQSGGKPVPVTMSMNLVWRLE